MKKLTTFLLLFLVTVSCMTHTPVLDSRKLYRKEMPIEVNGQKAEGGVYVLSKKPSYNFKAFLKRNAIVFKITSCHREWVIPDPHRKIEFEYTPIDGIENFGLCPLELGGFDLKGQHTWAYIDFKDDENLAAELSCNGKVTREDGVSICQSRVKLIQKIAFRKPVRMFSASRCNEPESEDGKAFTIEATPGKCVYLFVDNDGEKHRFTTIGYDDVLLRE